MSIRAYRVNSIEYKKDPSVNISHEWNEMGEYLSESGETMELSYEQLKQLTKNKKLSKETREQFINDLQWADEKGEPYITYHCW
jgi:hypothetical protein